MKIYVAGPYTATGPVEGQRNVDRAMAAGIVLIQRGHQPFVPHLTHYLDRYAWGLGVVLGYEEWMTYNRVWLAQCDALLYLAPSPGADRERAYAAELGLPIYDTLEQVPVAEAQPS